jgi:aspartyl-tRNA(Asn)/glutamyl-tRNA(Gln) amidotransferase subunit B
MRYETVIGLEVHAQLLTDSKIFCGCSTRFGAVPNSQVCPVCLGLPGVLPVLNRRAVGLCIRAGLCIHGKVAPFARFARKNYFYPDLPKGYQISMYELPLIEGGYLDIPAEAGNRRIGVKRIHMEEDAGKNLHEGIVGASHVDLNRAGVPLIEIVSDPDLRSPEEAIAYLKALRGILIYAGISDGDMEKGNFRCDANVSLRPLGTTAFGTRAEIKNVNSFRFVQKALEYEVIRQARLLDAGERVIQETRLWDTKTSVTQAMRSKEEAHDYRYFPDPDLLPLQVDQTWIEAEGAALPELPDAKRERFVNAYGLPPYDAVVLTGSPALADFYEKTVAHYPHPKKVSNWVMSELLREMNRDDQEIPPITPEHLAELLGLIDAGTVSVSGAKTVFERIYRSGEAPGAVVQILGLSQVSDDAELSRLVLEILSAYPGEVARYRAGEVKLLGFLVGQAMKRTGGRAHPGKINALLKQQLEGAG